MAQVVVNFVEPETAEMLVAGVPAAARAVREVLASAARRDYTSCTIVVGASWTPSPRCAAEIARLGAGFPVSVGDLAHPVLNAIYVAGDRFLVAASMDAEYAGTGKTPQAIFVTSAELMLARSGETLAERRERLGNAGRQIVKATGKVGDGPVSRWLNRPVSQAMTSLLLRNPKVKPMMATFGTMVIAVVMCLSLIFGGPSGVMWGALLFHAASVVDGVDGEIARATYRSSAAGARLDSVTDALTNIAFVTGLAFNLCQQGRTIEAAVGFTSVGLLGLGLFMLGRQAKKSGSHYGFNAVKDKFNAKGSGALRFLAKLAARDSFAFAFAVSAVLGLAAEVFMVFAFGVVVWFGVISTSLFRNRTAKPAR
jgi:1L-myo-inositol 1-phosphate cytidylyltransferase / CDP-L-myo-inositol myo-inositolphosphotransferase